MKSDLVIVYHRQPYEEVVENGEVVFRENKSPNGIVPTLKSFFGTVEQCSWVAWKQADTPEEADFPRVVRIQDSYGEYKVSRLPLRSDQVKSFYHVTSKEALWPILHSFPEKYDYDPVDWSQFREVNWLFAEAAAAEATDDAIVWVHDYNLWLTPAYLRQINPRLKVAFFHHTPFPAPDVFNILPWREEIVDSLLACDLVGFHIPRYAANFVNVARGLRDVQITESIAVEPGLSPVGRALSEPTIPFKLAHEGRIVHMDACPVGTNANYISDIVERDATCAQVETIRAGLNGRRLLISVGRSDYTKGTLDMLETYQRLLERRPELRGQVQLLCVSVAANGNMTVYQQVQQDIEAAVGRINGRYATLDWQPILLFTGGIPFEQLVAYYRAADVCWITPLRDGLNLVCKEYVAAREGLGGALILSEFTGAAVEMPHALLTNPYSTRAMDAVVDQALDMPEEEQQHRMAKLLESVRNYDHNHWANHTMQRFAELRHPQASAVSDDVDLA